MADIEAFRGIRYTQRDLSDLVSPPYDVLSQTDKQALLERCDQNIVAIDLPHTPPKNAGPDEVYERAAGEMVSWLDTRHLDRDAEPALYVYHQTFVNGGKTCTRRTFFARLRLEPFGTGSVYPHEQTFGGPKEDRLKLTVATRCNLSPIFGLYPDPANDVSAILEQDTDREPDATATMDGVQNALWVVRDEGIIDGVRRAMADKPIYIADGHHRYGTALNYRQLVVDETGEPMADDPVNFVLTVLCGMEDPGAVIQPYSRCIVKPARLTAARWRETLGEPFLWKPRALPRTPGDLAKALAAAGPSAFALYVGESDECGVLTPRDPDLLARYEPTRSAAWRRLAYSILHRHVIDEVVGPKFNSGAAPEIHYHKTMQECVEDARGSRGTAALMPATTMEQLRDICAGGELMPQKSTYFHPKLATGFVINPLY